MFACRWFEVFVLVLSVVKTVPTCVDDEDSPWLSRGECQTEAEQILSVQSNLRRHLMRSLVQVRERKMLKQGFDSVIGAIIRDLQTRDLDPFKLLTPANSNQEQLNTSLIEEALHNIQVGATPIDWSSALRNTPNIQLSPEHRQKIQQTDEPFVDFVLEEIQKGNLILNWRLLGDVLYNYRFKNYSPELVVILETVNETINRNFYSWGFSMHTTAFGPPDVVLSDILKSISLKVSSNERHWIDQLLSALPDKRNSIQFKKTRTWYGLMEDDIQELFDLILEDDYPPDVIYAKNALSYQGRYYEVISSDVNNIISENSPMEKLLMVLSRLIDDASHLQNYARIVYPHVKLRYLTSIGKFFRPETEADLTFLFDSFLTYNCDWSRMVLEEVQKVLSRWEEVLKDFKYWRYSKPRSLVLGMVEELLKEPTELPLCSIITLRYFLREHEKVSNCTADKSSEGLTVVGSAILESVTVTNLPEKPSPSVVATTTTLLTATPSLNPPQSPTTGEHYSQLNSSNTSVSPTPVSSDHPQSATPVLSPAPTPPQASSSPVATNPHNDSTGSSPTEIQLSTEDTSETSPNTNVTQQNEETRQSTVQLTPDEYPTSETRTSDDSASAEPSKEPDPESEN